MNKLEQLYESLSEKLAALHNLEEKPIYYYNWVKRKIKLEYQLLRIKYHG